MNGSLRRWISLKAFFVVSAATVLILSGAWKLWSLEWGEPALPPEVRPMKTPGKKHDRPDAMLVQVAQQLHHEAYVHFINQPGEGRGRLMPTVDYVKREWKMPDWTSEQLAKRQPPVQGAEDLEQIHGLTMRIFAKSNMMGKKERAESSLRNPLAKKESYWEIKSLDLVGLVTHENPIVYVSEKLPAMKDLKTIPTRALDLFESEGLEELVNGSSLYVRGKDETIRVLGPIRAGKACLNCHDDAKEGVMLGAFSYTLRPGRLVFSAPVPLVGIDLPRVENGPTPRPVP